MSARNTPRETTEIYAVISYKWPITAAIEDCQCEEPRRFFSHIIYSAKLKLSFLFLWLARGNCLSISRIILNFAKCTRRICHLHTWLRLHWTHCLGYSVAQFPSAFLWIWKEFSRCLLQIALAIDCWPPPWPPWALSSTRGYWADTEQRSDRGLHRRPATSGTSQECFVGTVRYLGNFDEQLCVRISRESHGIA